MSRPYTCPVCGGRGEVRRSGVREDMAWDSPYKTCHACNGKGIVWSPEPLRFEVVERYEPQPAASVTGGV